MEVFRILFIIFSINFSKVACECLELSSIKNFNSSYFYNGRWYLTKSYNQLISYLDGNCAYMDFTKSNELTTCVVDDVGENRVFEFPYELSKNSELNFSFNTSVPLMGIDYEVSAKVRKKTKKKIKNFITT